MTRRALATCWNCLCSRQHLARTRQGVRRRADCLGEVVGGQQGERPMGGRGRQGGRQTGVALVVVGGGGGARPSESASFSRACPALHSTLLSTWPGGGGPAIRHVPALHRRAGWGAARRGGQLWRSSHRCHLDPGPNDGFAGMPGGPVHRCTSSPVLIGIFPSGLAPSPCHLALAARPRPSEFAAAPAAAAQVCTPPKVLGTRHHMAGWGRQSEGLPSSGGWGDGGSSGGWGAGGGDDGGWDNGWGSGGWGDGGWGAGCWGAAGGGSSSGGGGGTGGWGAGGKGSHSGDGGGGDWGAAEGGSSSCCGGGTGGWGAGGGGGWDAGAGGSSLGGHGGKGHEWGAWQHQPKWGPNSSTLVKSQLCGPQLPCRGRGGGGGRDRPGAGGAANCWRQLCGNQARSRISWQK